MFSNASDSITNPARIFIETNDGRDALSQYVAQGATHDSRNQYDQPKCHPDTRKQLLGGINEWMLKPDKQFGILYLHGPPGVGKSCVARSACAGAEACPAEFLRASFFFWRRSEQCNNTMRLVTTIAYQLAWQNKELAKHIFAEIQRDPRIVHAAPIEHQFRKLILEPCRRMVNDRAGGQLNGAIIIDGLNECIDKEAQISVIQLIAKMVNQEQFPLGFFITSRPEFHLREVWDNEDIAPATQFISLSYYIPNAYSDIRTVLEGGFSRILNDRWFKRALQSVPRPWPDRRDLQILVERSSGQFIYAEAILKFVCRDHNPDKQLQIVLGIQSSDTSPLDSLYYEIISRGDNPARTIKVLAYIITIADVDPIGIISDEQDISTLLVNAVRADLQELCAVVERLLFFPEGEALSALNSLHSLIDFSTISTPFSFYHASFRDFLLTAERSKEFYVDIQATHAEIAQSCIDSEVLCRPEHVPTAQHVVWLFLYFWWRSQMRASGRSEQTLEFEWLNQRFRDIWGRYMMIP